MKGGSKLFIFAGVGLALVAIALLVSSLGGGGKTTADEDKAVETVRIVEAQSAVPAHALLTIDVLVEREIPEADAPIDAVTSIAEAAGMAYRVPLVAGQPLLRAQLETPGLRNDIAAGKRAIALPVNEISSMSGLVQDGDYIDIVFNARINLIRVITSDAADYLNTENTVTIKKDVILPYGEEIENYPLAGENGSVYVIHDDLGEQGELEAVAKIMLQDIRILRVIRPGDRFLSDGSRATGTVAEGTEQTAAASVGQFILEVTPEQAEFVNFIQDNHHTYQVIVRGKDDHETVNTTGVTYDILVAEEQWGLPYPKSISLDEDGNIVSERGAAATPTADGEPLDEDNAPSDEDE